MKKILIIAIIFIISGLASFMIFNLMYDSKNDYKKLSTGEIHDRIVEERDYAISQAVMEGNYRCCINPPCTMCFMEANEWNNHTPGTCACDDLIAEGKEPCPQCKRGLIKDTGTSCEISNSCDQNI
jgi:hypothetical protein